ncbi:DUF72 domain-containing protein, partial [Streptomyces sp. CSDS2]|uniref:DUF72 domain-containing protein n=1 Tax=Streptomyces sp. CSDS2 TaxID=3055051 RepID=UPI0025B0A393
MRDGGPVRGQRLRGAAQRGQRPRPTLVDPAGVPARRWLEEYTRLFATVEINNAFYRLPSYDTFAGWRERV